MSIPAYTIDLGYLSLIRNTSKFKAANGIVSFIVPANPWSYNFPIDNMDPEASDKKICAWCACMGREIISSRAVCVDCIVSLFGNRKQLPVFFSVTFIRGMEV